MTEREKERGVVLCAGDTDRFRRFKRRTHAPQFGLIVIIIDHVPSSIDIPLLELFDSDDPQQYSHRDGSWT